MNSELSDKKIIEMAECHNFFQYADPKDIVEFIRDVIVEDRSRSNPACDECGGDGIVLAAQSTWACEKCAALKLDGGRYQKLRDWMGTNTPEGWKKVEELGALCAWVGSQAMDAQLDEMPTLQDDMQEITIAPVIPNELISKGNIMNDETPNILFNTFTPVEWADAPAWANYVATDMRGSCYFYELRPTPDLLINMWRPDFRGQYLLYIRAAEDTIISNWKDSLYPRSPEVVLVDDKIEVNWDTDDIPSWANYMALDEDGSLYMFEKEPDTGATKWWINDENDGMYERYNLSSYTTQPKWKASLVARPNIKPIDEGVVDSPVINYCSFSQDDVLEIMDISKNNPHLSGAEVISLFTDPDYAEFNRLKKKFANIE